MKRITKQGRKKRKELYTSAMHLRRKRIHVHLSKELKKKYKKRALLAKKGDKIRIVRGDFRKREGKITGVNLKKGKIFIAGVVRRKQSGKEVQISIMPSNCILVEWNEPKKREKRAKAGAKEIKAGAKAEIKASAKMQEPISSAQAL